MSEVPNKNYVICLNDFDQDYEQEIEFENSTYHDAVSKCCSVTQIFDAAINSCQDGNFTVDQVEFYRTLNSSDEFEKVTDLDELDGVEFTTGLLEDSDCPGASRK